MTNEQIFEISYRWRKGQDSFDIARALRKSDPLVSEADVEMAIFKYVIRVKKVRAA